MGNYANTNRMPLTRLDLDFLPRMAICSSCGPSSKPRPRHFARQCQLEAIKCPVRSSTSCRCSFRRSRSNRAFGPAKSDLMRGRTLHWSGRKSLPLLDLPSPLPPSPPTSKSWPEYRSSWAPPRSSRVALKSFPRSSRSPLAAVGRWCKGGTQGGRWPPPPLCLLNFVTPRM